MPGTTKDHDHHDEDGTDDVPAPPAAASAGALTAPGPERQVLKAVLWLGIMLGFAVGVATGVLLVHHRDGGRHRHHREWEQRMEERMGQQLEDLRDRMPPPPGAEHGWVHGPGASTAPAGPSADAPRCMLPEGCEPPAGVPTEVPTTTP